MVCIVKVMRVVMYICWKSNFNRDYVRFMFNCVSYVEESEQGLNTIKKREVSEVISIR